MKGENKIMILNEYIANHEQYEEKVAAISRKLLDKQPLTDEEKELRRLEQEMLQENKEFRSKHPEGLYGWIYK